MALNNVSITSMHHTTLTDISYFLDDTLAASGSDGSFETYTLESFRRLYNDAVESMNAYHTLAESYKNKAEHYQKLYDNKVHELYDD